MTEPSTSHGGEPLRQALVDTVAARWGQRQQFWARVVLFPAGLTASSILLSRGSGPPFTTGVIIAIAWVGLQVLEAVIVLRHNYLQDRDETSIAVAAAARHNLTNDLCGRIAAEIAVMSRENKAARELTFHRLIQQIPDNITLIFSEVLGLRAVVYGYDETELGLIPLAYNSVGHRRPPKPFIGGSDRAEKALDTIQRGEHLFVDSISRAPASWQGSGNGYDTFLSAPVVSAWIRRLSWSVVAGCDARMSS